MALPGGAAGYVSSSPEPPALFVRAMYDYTTEDYTSLSFRQGDIIQVLNQLETGWWDGVIDNIRGWFPSNYCAVVTDPIGLGDRFAHGQEDNATSELGIDDDFDDARTADPRSDHDSFRGSQATLLVEGNGGNTEDEEAAFWIPQATPDGRLFYFNTLTGSSTMELPFEEAGDGPLRDPNFLFSPDLSRPPPEMMARGFERDEGDYDGSASEVEGESLILASQNSLRQSMIDGVSPATSMDSLNPPSYSIRELKGLQQLPSWSKVSVSTGSNTLLSDSSTIPQHFVDEATSTPLSWAILVDNMSRATEAYSQVLRDGNRPEYVRKAEDISDHLRMILAAGSDTTDNHSGNPSIISSNKALYPHFRDMMSKFSKLVLWSHIASGDWPGVDSTQKCLQEAERVMQSILNYVDVARQQRGDSIRRIVPGFVVGSSSGGNWHNNGASLNMTGPTTFLDQDNGGDSQPERMVPLSLEFLDHLDVLRRSLVGNIRKLDDQLSIQQKLVTTAEHEEIANSISTAAVSVVEQFRPWISVVESVNLAPLLRNDLESPQLVDFSVQKQRAYDAIADFVLNCQAVSVPLSDEWAELRGDSLMDRLHVVRETTRNLDNYVSQIGFSLSLLLEQIPDFASDFKDDIDFGRFADGESIYEGRDGLDGSIGIPFSYPADYDLDGEKRRKNMSKAERFFGHRPPARPEEAPWFLQFDHEGELFYDTRNGQPMVKCGTLPALVEHLTRHDKLDTSFNNTFLITYRSFTTAPELFSMLVDRFNIQPPPGLTDPSDKHLWIDKKQKPIRFRVVNILKNWIELHWVEMNDEASQELLRQMSSFTENTIVTTKTPRSAQLLQSIEQRMRGERTAGAKKLVRTPNASAPTPIKPKNLKKLRFLDMDATELARQLTLMEAELYSRIKPVECLNKTWQKKIPTGDPEPAANVKALILHSNQLTNWVAHLILEQNDVKKRVVVIKHFVNVADVRSVVFLQVWTNLADPSFRNAVPSITFLR